MNSSVLIAFAPSESAAALSAPSCGDGFPASAASKGGLIENTATPDTTAARRNVRRAQALRELLSTPLPAGSKHFIVSHRPKLQDAAGKEFGDLSEAVASSN
jgi:hypothetical protein